MGVFCTNCGQELPSGVNVKYCPNCGKLVNENNIEDFGTKTKKDDEDKSKSFPPQQPSVVTQLAIQESRHSSTHRLYWRHIWITRYRSHIHWEIRKRNWHTNSWLVSLCYDDRFYFWFPSYGVHIRYCISHHVYMANI